jgi:hypothetical protein
MFIGLYPGTTGASANFKKNENWGKKSVSSPDR